MCDDDDDDDEECELNGNCIDALECLLTWTLFVWKEKHWMDDGIAQSEREEMWQLSKVASVFADTNLWPATYKFVTFYLTRPSSRRFLMLRISLYLLVDKLKYFSKSTIYQTSTSRSRKPSIKVDFLLYKIFSYYYSSIYYLC